MVGIFKNRQNVFCILAVFLVGDMMNKLFSVDISQMKSAEISKWLENCRNAIDVKNYEKYDEYLSDVALFCEEWEKHYEKYEKTYKSKKYEKAILSMGVLKPKFKLECSDGIVDIEENLFYDILSSRNTKPEFEKEKGISNFEFWCEEYSTQYSTPQHKLSFNNPEDYKPMFIYAVQNLFSYTRSYKIRVINNRKAIKGLTYKQLLEALENDRNLKVAVVKKVHSNSYLNELEKYGVRSTTYTDFINPFKEQKHFEKLMFINLCFACALPLSLSSKFLTYNGFSIENSTREFDKICEKSLRLGFPREYAIALIDRYNKEHEHQHSFNKIGNL